MKLAIASDHAGFELKETLVHYLSSHGCDCQDLGTSSATTSVDYPDFASRVAKLVAEKSVDRGVLVCGSGIGMAIAANRIPGARAVVLRDSFDAEMSRRHNDANIACLGARITSAKEASRLLDIWLSTAFEGDRHIRRVQKLDIVS